MSVDEVTILNVCPRPCSICEGNDHHWMGGFLEDEDGNIIDEGDPIMKCKHCDAVREINDDDDEF